MPRFLGEYDVKVDSKARLRLPKDLLRQFGKEEGEDLTFVLNRGFENCLVIYPKYVWDRITKEIDKLNIYKKKNREFVRYFYRGATELTLDKSDRVLIPKRLTEYAKIQSDVILFAYQDRVELWSQEYYNAWMENEPEDFSDLAEEVMGNALSDDQSGQE